MEMRRLMAKIDVILVTTCVSEMNEDEDVMEIKGG